MKERFLYEKNLTQQEELLSRIINVLALNANFVKVSGLGYGKMGIAIFFYNCYRAYSNNDYEFWANALIDDIYEEINAETRLDFGYGLSGIGWGIEYLSQNGFIEGNPDEILDDVDRVISKEFELCRTNEPLKPSIAADLITYLTVRRHKTVLKIVDLKDYIKPRSDVDKILDIKYLVNSDNYGLFEGMAGIGFSVLTNLKRIN